MRLPFSLARDAPQGIAFKLFDAITSFCEGSLHFYPSREGEGYDVLSCFQEVLLFFHWFQHSSRNPEAPL